MYAIRSYYGLFNRTLEKAERLAQALGPDFAAPIRALPLADHLDQVEILPVPWIA